MKAMNNMLVTTTHALHLMGKTTFFHCFFFRSLNKFLIFYQLLVTITITIAVAITTIITITITVVNINP